MSETPKTEDAGWWEHSLNRRDAHKLGLGIAAVAAATGCDDTKVVDLDSMEAQKKGGWNVGDADTKLRFNGGTKVDSKGGSTWKAYMPATELMKATRPANETRAKWQMPTLFQSMEQVSLAAQMKPVSTAATQETYNKARALGSVLQASEDSHKTLLIVDVPGAHGPAAAAGMAEWVEPVFKLDNWPHPKGVVKSHETLGATLYYANELQEKKSKRDAAKAPTALILDSNRLTAFTAPDKQFDNRYFVDLPSADELKSAGIEKVLYVPLQEQKDESDDLNDTIVAYGKAGVQVTQVPFGSFGKDPNYKPTEGHEDPSRGYYYGHSHRHHTHFYSHYPMFMMMSMGSSRYGWAPRGGAGPSRVRAPSYKPSSRPTAFSSRTTGGARGVGRAKPTGFGRVSSRVNSSGKIMGTRSGSTGRFRSSSSFGG